MVHRILSTDNLNMMTQRNKDNADINNIQMMLHCAYIQGYEEAERQYKATDVHTDNSEVIDNLQADMDRLTKELATIEEKAERCATKLYPKESLRYGSYMRGFVECAQLIMKEITNKLKLTTNENKD